MSSASVAVFRIGFGLAMVVNAALYVPVLVREYYIEPDVHFPYWPFEFVRPLPAAGMYAVYALMMATGALIALGLWYRFAAWAFFGLTTYVFLLDSSYYQNHEYLISILAAMLAVLPADGRWSLDVRWGRRAPAATVPAWVVWLLRFQIGVPYFFGGIAKLNDDWFHGEPLRSWIAGRTDVEPINTILTTEWVVYVMAYGALILDLTIVAFLLARRTRVAAFVVVTCFHLVNAWLFGLFIFPWLMIVATTIFFPPDWPERVLARWTRRPTLPPPRPPARLAAPEHRGVLPLLAVWAAVQLVLPVRHVLLPGEPSWTEHGHRYAWHMKLRDKTGTVTFVVTTADGEHRIDPRQHLGALQAARLAGHPERLVRFARYLSARYGGAEVRAETHVSLNGRPPQPIVDPDVDLASIRLPIWSRAPWIVPLERAPSTDAEPRSAP